MENRASSQADLLSSTSSSLASSLRQTAEKSQDLLEEMNGYCSDLHGAVSGTEGDEKFLQEFTAPFFCEKCFNVYFIFCQ